MISRQHRFHGRGGLRRLYQSGKTLRGPLFALKIQQNPHRKDYRLAVVVSRKVEKSAVKRNRMRRRIYGVFSEIAIEIVGPQDILVTVYSNDLLDLPSDKLRLQMQKLLNDAGALAKKTT